MNKSELTAAIAEASGMTKKDANAFTNATLEVLAETLAKGERVQLAGLGAFYIHERTARQGKNPKTGELVTIPAARIPVFKAGKAFKEKVNK